MREEGPGGDSGADMERYERAVEDGRVPVRKRRRRYRHVRGREGRLAAPRSSAELVRRAGDTGARHVPNKVEDPEEGR